MNSFLETHTLRLEMLGPVFIGSGRTINKKEYVRAGKRAYIFDVYKMYRGLSEMGLTEDFEEYMLVRRPKADLAQWFREHKVKEDVYRQWTAYEIDGGDISFESNPNKEIHTFIKDAYQKPYIPGSSVKGMLRTILAAYSMGAGWNESGAGEKQREILRLKDDIKRNIYEGRAGRNKKFLEREGKQLNNIVFNDLNRNEKRKSDAVNDIMSQFRIGDSRPLETDCLVLCQKVELNEAGVDRRLPLLRECIKPGTVVELPVTIDTSLSKFISIETIKYAVNGFDKMYNEVFRSKFIQGAKAAEGIVYLGGGAGFVGKTAVYPMFGETEGVKMSAEVFKNTLHQKIYKEHGHASDVRRGVSPHICKMTYWNKMLYEMGRCRMEII